MSARLFCNVVYAWLMSGCAGDADARRDLDAQLYAPARGLDEANASFWAAIMRPEDGE